MKLLKCPKCKSTKIDVYSSIITGNYFCRKCGIFTPIILEEEIKIKKIKRPNGITI